MAHAWWPRHRSITQVQLPHACLFKLCFIATLVCMFKLLPYKLSCRSCWVGIICHACGVPTFTRFVDNEDFMDTQMAVVDKVLRWSWFIIDVISMVSATLLVKMRVP